MKRVITIALAVFCAASLLPARIQAQTKAQAPAKTQVPAQAKATAQASAPAKTPAPAQVQSRPDGKREVAPAKAQAKATAQASATAPTKTQAQPQTQTKVPAQAQSRPDGKREVAPARPRCREVQYLDIDPHDTKAPLEQEVAIERDIVYDAARNLHMIIYRPAEARRSLPCILYIKGSGWHKQDIAAYGEFLSKIAAKGYVVASMEYRPVEVAKMPAQARDAAGALGFLKDNCGRWGIDPGNMFLFGGSSGGHTALLLGLSMDEGRVNAIVDYYGPTDLLEQLQEKNLPRFLSGSTPEELRNSARECSPINYVTPDSPPVMIVHGAVDPTVDFSQSDRLAMKYDAAGAPMVFYCVNGGAHGSPHFWTDGMVTLIDAFLKDNIR